MNDLYKKIGKRIDKIRKDVGISQKELAEKIGVTPSEITYIKRGKRKISLLLLIKIAKVLDVSVDYLIGISKNEGIFIDRKVITAFENFKKLNRKDRAMVLNYIEFLKYKK